MKRSVLFAAILCLSAASFATTKAAPKKAADRKPASAASCQTGAADDVASYVASCSSGKWLASGGAGTSTVCCIEVPPPAPIDDRPKAR